MSGSTYVHQRLLSCAMTSLGEVPEMQKFCCTYLSWESFGFGNFSLRKEWYRQEQDWGLYWTEKKICVRNEPSSLHDHLYHPCKKATFRFPDLSAYLIYSSVAKMLPTEDSNHSAPVLGNLPFAWKRQKQSRVNIASCHTAKQTTTLPCVAKPLFKSHAPTFSNQPCHCCWRRQV